MPATTISLFAALRHFYAAAFFTLRCLCYATLAAADAASLITLPMLPISIFFAAVFPP